MTSSPSAGASFFPAVPPASIGLGLDAAARQRFLNEVANLDVIAHTDFADLPRGSAFIVWFRPDGAIEPPDGADSPHHGMAEVNNTTGTVRPLRPASRARR